MEASQDQSQQDEKVSLKLKTFFTLHTIDQELIYKLWDKGLGNLYHPVKDIIGCQICL